MLFIARCAAIPVLVLLYLCAGIPLVGRDACHRIVVVMDWMFDAVASLVKWDSRYWPLPKASESPLPYADEESEAFI